MAEDIFACLDRILVQGPSADELRPIHEDSEAPGVAANDDQPLCADPPLHNDERRAAPDARAQRAASFLADDKMDHYEQDVDKIGVIAPGFSPIVPTTFGLSGALSKIAFNESTLMPRIGAHLRYPCIRAVSNFGDVMVDNFQELVSTKKIDMSTTIKSARVRAKKHARMCAKPRKVQGNGTCFNSSILFWIFSDTYNTVYKIRLFRTGQFGLPGTKPMMIRDILHLVRNAFIPMLSAILSVADIELLSLFPIMKNYKWQRIIAENQILNLPFIAERIQSDTHHPFPISYVKCDLCSPKLSIKFNTPASGSADASASSSASKMVRINIFLSGKINILGAHEVDVTRELCRYIIGILTDDVLIVRDVTGADDDVMEDSDPGAQYSDVDDVDTIVATRADDATTCDNGAATRADDAATSSLIK